MILAQKPKERKTISLETYKYQMGNKREVASGESKVIRINRAWLIEQIAPQSLDEFLSEYTYDESEYLYRKYLTEQNDAKPHDKP